MFLNLIRNRTYRDSVTQMLDHKSCLHCRCLNRECASLFETFKLSLIGRDKGLARQINPVVLLDAESVHHINLESPLLDFENFDMTSLQYSTAVSVLKRFKSTCKSIHIGERKEDIFMVAFRSISLGGWGSLRRISLRAISPAFPHLRKALQAVPELTSLSIHSWDAVELDFPIMPKLSDISLTVIAPTRNHVQVISLKPFPSLKSLGLYGWVATDEEDDFDDDRAKWSVIGCEESHITTFVGDLCSNVEFQTYIIPKIEKIGEVLTWGKQPIFLRDMKVLSSLKHLKISTGCSEGLERKSREVIAALRKFALADGVIEHSVYAVKAKIENKSWVLDARGMRTWKQHISNEITEQLIHNAERFMARFFQILYEISPLTIISKSDSTAVGELLDRVKTTFQDYDFKLIEPIGF